MLFKKKFNKNLLLSYSSNLLISNYSHIGFKKNLTSHSFRKALLCFYSNIAIINPYLTLANLRFSLNFLFKLLLKNLKTCFVIFDFPKSFRKFFSFKDQFFFFNNWVSGFLTNYSSHRKFNVSKRNKFCTYLPSSIVVFGAKSQKSADIAMEANKLLLPSFIFIDSLSNPSIHSYWIPMNLKSGYTKIFFINLVNSFLIKFFYLKRFFFLKNFFELFNTKEFKRRHTIVTLKNKKINRFFFKEFYSFFKQSRRARTLFLLKNLWTKIMLFQKKYPERLYLIQYKLDSLKRIIKKKIKIIKKCD